MKKITILGLNHKGVGPSTVRGREVWTLGDFYRPFPWLKPGRVYQIHTDFDGKHEDPTRYLNWRDEYEKSGAEIIVTTPLGFSRERIFDIPRALAEFNNTIFACTTGYMFAEAIWEGVQNIELQGFGLTLGSEYYWQAPVMLCAIEIARSRGIEVSCLQEEKWRAGFPLTRWAELQIKAVIGDTNQSHCCPGKVALEIARCEVKHG